MSFLRNGYSPSNYNNKKIIHLNNYYRKKREKIVKRIHKFIHLPLRNIQRANQISVYIIL
jgi:hypothetical protein